MKFDYDILFEFIPEKDKKSFMVWNNAFLAGTASTRLIIRATYRAPFEESISIPFEDYQIKLKQKERDIKINNLIHNI